MFFSKDKPDEGDPEAEVPVSDEPVQQEWLTPDQTDPMVAVRARHAAAKDDDGAA